MYLRASEASPQRHWYRQTSLGSSHEFGAGQRPCGSHEGIDERQIDSSHEAGWWNPRHCDRMCTQKIGCQDLSTGAHEGVRVRMRSISVCPLNTSGTDCLGHLLRAATNADPQATILSVDGIGAYDHVQMLLGGRWWQTEVRHTSRGWRTGGPTHAFVVFHRDTRGT